MKLQCGEISLDLWCTSSYSLNSAFALGVSNYTRVLCIFFIIYQIVFSFGQLPANTHLRAFKPICCDIHMECFPLSMQRAHSFPTRVHSPAKCCHEKVLKGTRVCARGRLEHKQVNLYNSHISGAFPASFTARAASARVETLFSDVSRFTCQLTVPLIVSGSRIIDYTKGLGWFQFTIPNVSSWSSFNPKTPIF